MDPHEFALRERVRVADDYWHPWIRGMIGTIIVPQSKGEPVETPVLSRWIEFDEPFQFPGHPGPLTVIAVADSALAPVKPDGLPPNSPTDSH